MVRAVDAVSLEFPRGSVFGLVGESGSGKTTLGRAILKAAPITYGHVAYCDEDVDYDVPALNKAELKDCRKRPQLIFQDPYAALSPRMTVRDIIAEPLEVMRLTSSRKETDERVREIAAKCRLDLEHLRRLTTMHGKSVSTPVQERSQSGNQSEDDQTECDISRRQALISISKYATYVTPAMTVLVRGSTALASHSCNGGNDGQGHAHSCIP